MEVHVLSKLEFIEFIKGSSINNDNVENMDILIISINDTTSDNKIVLDNKSNVKVLYFDDTDRDIVIPIIGSNDEVKAKACTLEQAEELFYFIERNKHKNTCIIHCSAGISRSGAVGTFIVDYFNLDWFKFKSNNPHIHPNNHVLKLLKTVLNKKTKSD
ncbi:MAG: hypothetical protein ACOC3V_02130 [bacterium]